MIEFVTAGGYQPPPWASRPGYVLTDSAVDGGSSMRSEAQAVVIGGGVGGASIAYHLARLGWKDVVLVEQYELTSGSTWHSGGLAGQLRSSVSLTRVMVYSVGLV